MNLNEQSRCESEMRDDSARQARRLGRSALLAGECDGLPWPEDGPEPTPPVEITVPTAPTDERPWHLARIYQEPANTLWVAVVLDSRAGPGPTSGIFCRSEDRGEALRMAARVMTLHNDEEEGR